MSNSPTMPLEEAQARLLTLAKPGAIERVEIRQALGRYLAEPVLARRTQPSSDLSAMDGYAVADDGFGGPWKVVGESSAGHPFHGMIGDAQAVRISTGAAIPFGAGCVILQEDVERQPDAIALTGEGPLPPSKHIRRRGMDFHEGQEILLAGKLVGAAQIALAKAAGQTHFSVRKPPRVVVIDSGDELLADSSDPSDDKIPASNGEMLSALIAPLQINAKTVGPIQDTLQDLTNAFEAAGDADIIVTSGGASVGDHDLVRPALERWGASIDFWRVAIKPGKPLLVATRDCGARKQIILGLPGNPVSSFVTAYLFLLPLLRQLLGASEAVPNSVSAKLGASVRSTGSRREFLRGRWDGMEVLPLLNQDSAALYALSECNVLIDRAAHAPAAGKGENVPVFMLRNGGIL